jgi:hypothetical protein
MPFQAQTSVAKRMPASVKAVPILVVDAFKEAYPGVMVKGWYVTHITYWYNDVSSGWYADWYNRTPDIVYVYEQANFFEVEFVEHPGELSRAIYNKYGYWYETRTQIASLPQNVIDALNNSEYANWKRSMLKEKIDSNEWPEPVYRFKMSKGMKSMILKMNANGDFVQEMNPNQ